MQFQLMSQLKKNGLHDLEHTGEFHFWENGIDLLLPIPSTKYN